MTEKIIRNVARFLVVWMTTVWSVQVNIALAQSIPPIPGVQPGQIDIQNAVSQRREDAQTETTLMNMRATKISNGINDDTKVRTVSPNATTDNVPLRTPNTNSAQDVPRSKTPLSTEDIVGAAQRSSDFGMQYFNDIYRPNSSNVSFEKPNPNDKTTQGRVNVREIIPSYSKGEFNRMKAIGETVYNSDASPLKNFSSQNDINLRRMGCRKTDFYLLERQDITRAGSDPSQRILKVEFFDIKKEAIPNTNPVQYNITYTKTTYKKGSVKLNFPTIGGTSQQGWVLVGDDYGILYTYTPYTQPKNRNYFTYNHQVAIAQNGTVSVLPNAVASYGSREDAFTTVVSLQIPYGVSEIYVSADLYLVEANYFDPGQGNACPPDPPTTCEMPSLNGGDTIRWCGNSPGANIYALFDDTLVKTDQMYGRDVTNSIIGNVNRADYKDKALEINNRTDAIFGLYAPKIFDGCQRLDISSSSTQLNLSYNKPDIYTCTEALVNPYPDGCNSIKRSFGLSYLTDQNYLTVRAYQKIANPVIDPKTGKQAVDSNGNPMWTYTKQPANVSGPILINVPIMGTAQCPLGNTPTGRCSTESVPDREEYILEYDSTPAYLDTKQYVVNGVYIAQGGSASVTNYGHPADSWTPSGSATADGTYAQVRVMAKIYQVTINQFVGCEKYINYLQDGICQGGKLTCTDYSPTRTVGGVTFGKGLPNEGIVDVLKKWATDSSEVFPDYSDADSGDPSSNGPSISLLSDDMCWEAKGEPFQQCYSMPTNNLTQFMRNGQIWATDCDKTLDPKGIPLSNSSSCTRNSNYDDCDSRWYGLFTETCYNPTIAYDCGEKVSNNTQITTSEKGDFCAGAIRCMGTECHRPNLIGDSKSDFIQATSQLSALNMGAMDMICAETGERPTSPNQTCTPLIFGGTKRYCKIPIGSDIGLTPNCCDEAKKAAGQVDVNWMQYLQLTMKTYSILNNEAFKHFVFSYDSSYPYTAASKTFGNVGQSITDMYQSASNFIQNNFVKPFTNVLDNEAKRSTIAAGGDLSATQIDSPLKGANPFDFIDNFTQAIYKNIYENLPSDLANMIFSQDSAGKLTLQLLPSSIILAFEIYSWLSILGHIIFACKEEEFQWGLDNKLRLCSFAGTCCSKKLPLIGCIEKRKLYCCYKSIAARVIAEQIINKNLDGAHKFGFKTSQSGTSKLKKCSINCSGLNPNNLANVDWSQIDLSEWTDSLIQSGMINPNNLQADFGVTPNGIQSSNAMARETIDLPQLDQADSPAVKNLEILQQHVETMTDMTKTLRSKTPCYVDSRKMPMYDPSCDN